MADEEAVIIIRELEGEFRSCVLFGPNLPDQLQTAVEIRSQRTHYPGNSSPSTQILGTKEDDIILEGQFRDTWTRSEGDALLRVGTLRAIALSARLCELSWGSTVVRRGFLKRVEPTYKRAGIIAYRLVFEVSEADEAVVVTPRSFPPAPETDLAAVMARIQLKKSLLEAAVGLFNVLSGVI